MSIIKKKLKSKSGASIIIALVFFLVCAVIGGIVLASAMSNAGRVRDMRAGQQAYLSVSSAAKLIRDDIYGAVFKDLTGNGELTLISDENAVSRALLESTGTMHGGAADTSVAFVVSYGEDEVTVELSVTKLSDSTLSAVAVLRDSGSLCNMTVTAQGALGVLSVSSYGQVPSAEHADDFTTEQTDTAITTIVFGYGTIETGGDF